MSVPPTTSTLPACRWRGRGPRSAAARQRWSSCSAIVLDFAYPFGGYNPAVVQLVQQAGFRDAVSIRHGTAQSLGSLFLLHRTEVGGAPSLATFARQAGTAAPSAAQLAAVMSLAPVRAGLDIGGGLSRAA